MESNKLTPYEKINFWETYTRLYWCNYQQQEIGKAVKCISNNLSVKSSPLKVLVLGSGIGTIELPLLARLEEELNTEVHITAVDFRSEPLNILEKILQNGLTSIPKTGEEFIKILNNNWFNKKMRKVSSIGPHKTIVDNLDVDKHILDITSVPSQWLTRLEKELKTSLPCFDIVTAAFVFFHLDWWRPTLMSALEALKPGGVFLHPYMKNHEELFEGRQPAGKLPPIAKKIFIDGFYKNGVPANYIRRTRNSSATSPIAFNTFVSRLKYYSVQSGSSENQSEGTYTINNKVGIIDYLNLLKERGFSTFRFIDKEMGEENYDQHIEQVEKKVREEYKSSDREEISFEVHWQLLKKLEKDQLGNLQDAPWCQKFLLSPPPQKAPTIKPEYIKELELKAERIYEIEEATSEGWLIPNIKAEDKLRSFMVTRMSTSGLFHKSCIAGNFAYAGDAQPSAEFACFINPLHSSKNKRQTIEQSANYLKLLEIENYSNSRTLLKEFMPEYGKPCIFTYVRGKTAKVSVRYHSDFMELRFTIPKFDDKELKSLNEKISRKTRIIKNTFTFDIDKSPKKPKEDLKIRELIEKYFTPHNLDKILKQYKKSFSTSEQFDQALLDKLKDKINHRMIKTILSLNLIQDWENLVIYPATYYDNNRPTADHAIILFYDKELQSEELKHEYRKITLLYRRQGIMRAQELSRKRTQKSDSSLFSHEVSQLTAAFSNTWMVKLKNVIKIQIDKNIETKNSFGTLITSEKYGKLLEPALLCLYPDLIYKFTGVLDLWCLTPTPENYFYNLEKTEWAKNLEESIKYAWQNAVDCLYIHTVSSIAINSDEKVSEAEQYQKLFRQLFRLNINSNRLGKRMGICWDEKTDKKPQNKDDSMWFMRLLQTLCFEAVRHGNPVEPFELKIEKSKSNHLVFEWVNNKGKIEKKEFTRIFPELGKFPALDENIVFSQIRENQRAMGETPAGIDGRDIFRHCLEQLKGKECGEDDKDKKKFVKRFQLPEEIFL